LSQISSSVCLGQLDSKTILPTILSFGASEVVLINMPETDIIEIHEDDGIFIEQEWIGIGKQECVDLPNFVKAAREASESSLKA